MKKKCTMCGRAKPLDEFDRARDGLHGRRGGCKDCTRVRRGRAKGVNVSDAEKLTICKMRRGGAKMTEIAKAVGRPWSTVRRVLSREGLDTARYVNGRRIDTTTQNKGDPHVGKPMGELPLWHPVRAVDEAAIRDRRIYDEFDAQRRRRLEEAGLIPTQKSA